MNPQVIKTKHEPLEPGFMRNGFFAWPSRNYTCADCKTEFQSTTGSIKRCQNCRKAHRRRLKTASERRRLGKQHGLA